MPDMRCRNVPAAPTGRAQSRLICVARPTNGYLDSRPSYSAGTAPVRGSITFSSLACPRQACADPLSAVLRADRVPPCQADWAFSSAASGCRWDCLD
jgi:hypothetical protein